MWISQQAAIEASSELERLHVVLDSEVDIFSAIEQADLPLMFRPLKYLSGVYIPANEDLGSAPGILINSNHPRSRQRYTAAHEYAHHLQDKELSLDYETEIFERTQQMALPERERYAEVFASWFLMPPQLITNLTVKFGIDLAHLDPIDIYQLSLAMGTSYRATVTQLSSLRYIGRSQAQTLRSWQPKQIKEKLAWDGSIISPRNDTWIINEKYNDLSIHPREGDEILISLAEVPSTGYIWVRSDSEQTVTLIGQRFVDRNKELLFGIRGQREFKFLILEAGISNLVLSMQRPWLGEPSNVDTFHLKLLIEGDRLGINQDYLLAQPQIGRRN